MYNVTLWQDHITIVSMETQQYLPLLRLLAYMSLSTIFKCSVMPWKRNNGFPLHCCQATKYFTLYEC